MDKTDIDSMTAGRGMDVFITKMLMGKDIPPYSTDLKAAWEIVEMMISEGYDVEIEYNGSWYVAFTKYDENDSDWVLGGSTQEDQLPLAICKAALLTRVVG
jgi:hypothetical protein